jgi:transposase-like protein
MELQQESGLSVRAFCRQESLSEPSFYAWRRRLRLGEDGRPSVPDAAANFVPVHVAESPSPLWIELADGVTLRVHAGCPLELLRTAVEALRC